MNTIKQLLIIAVLCGIFSQTTQTIGSMFKKGPQGQLFKLDPQTFTQKWSYQTSSTKEGASHPTYSSIKSFTKKNISFDRVPGMSIKVFKGPNGDTSKGTIDIPADAIATLDDESQAIAIDSGAKFEVLPLDLIKVFQKGDSIQIRNTGSSPLYFTSLLKDSFATKEAPAIYYQYLQIEGNTTKRLPIPKNKDFAIQVDDSSKTYLASIDLKKADLNKLKKVPLKFDSKGNRI